MPDLSFGDVFNNDRARIMEHIKQLEEAVKVSNIFIMYFLKVNNQTKATVGRKEFFELLGDRPHDGVTIRASGEEIVYELIEEDEHPYTQ